MKKTLLVAFFSIMLLLSSQKVKAQDGVFSDGLSLSEGSLTSAAQFTFLTQADDFMLFGRARYGLKSNQDIAFKLGLLQDFVFVGAHLEQLHLSSENNTFHTYYQYGIQFWNDMGLKASYNAALNFKKVRIYTGLLYQPYFSEDIIHPLLLPVGLSFRPNEIDGYIYFELNGAVSDDADAFSAIHFGTKLNLGKLQKN